MKKFFFKKRLALTLALTLLFTSFGSIAYAAETPKEGDQATFQILFTSDTHGSMTSYNYATGKSTVGSFSQVATLIEREKAAFNGRTFLVDNGDTIQGNGTSFFINNDEYKPFPLVKAMQKTGYEIMSLGNHEFNFGMDALNKAYSGFTGAKLCGNVLKQDGSLMDGFSAYSIKTLDNGLRVAFIGAVTPNIDLWDTSNLKKAGLHTISAADSIRKSIDELKKKNLADVFVAVTHMGDTGEYGREGSGAVDVAKKNPELAAILGAHYHTITGTADKQVVLSNNVKFVENKNAGGSLGKVLVTATYENGQWVLKNKTATDATASVKTDVISVTKDIPLNTKVESSIQKADQAARNYITQTVIGKLQGGPLVPEPQIKGTYEGYLGDTALIDLINNVMFYYTKADISGTAPLDANANHTPGEITIGGVVQIYKYDNNTLYKLSMTGAQVKQWMEWSYSYFGSTTNGVFNNNLPAVNTKTDLTIPTGTMQGYNQDQFSGIKYEVDLTKPVGQRIHILSMSNGTAFNMNKEYVVAANNYRSSTQLLTTSPTGVFKPGEKTAKLIASDIQAPNGSTSMMDLIIDYIGKQPNKTITNTCDHNWKFVNLNWDKALRAKAIQYINSGDIVTDFKVPVTKAQVLKIMAQKGDKLPDISTLPASTDNGTYTVKNGDTLSKIAKDLLNDSTQWKKIYELNKDTVKNPNLIYPGQKLVIPA
ncbi:5'-nucleotidase C-terminal domain-containing protein [Faecalispora anaeroviscerum]|uniref:5'-nucleotidase C-terminal domain-containing protein n=1 Tax=Faecalispora anaeroviscerum TaxID=2991836 RepID=UPI0024BA2127|nr:5'-nucleotidase C-terminal domain-containing protein [Faecalispora anaeroviscerum]